MVVIQLYISIINDKEAIYANEITQEKLDAWHKTLLCLEQLSVHHPISEDWKNITWGGTTQDLPNEKCLFYSNGSWMYNIWVEENPEKVMNCVPVEYPGFNKAVIYPTVYPVMWGVLKNSPNKEAAINFMIAMNKPEMAEQWVRQTKCPTGIKGNLTEITFGSDQFENYFYYLKKNYAGNGYKMRENSLFILGADYQYNHNYFMEVLTGELSADEGMQKLMESIPPLNTNTVLQAN
jgi:ABC-type glycerol-3-phosphate transport system substrate-binding protein